MKNRNSSVKKITRAIQIFVVVWSIVFVASVIAIRINSNIPAAILYLCATPVYIVGLYLFQKLIEHSRWSRAFEEANRECEQEEINKKAIDESPGFSSLAIIALIGFINVVSGCVDVVRTITTTSAPLSECLPQCIDILTQLSCSTFIAVILYNVLHKRVFDSLNSFCIYGIGATILFSALLQNECWDSTPMMPNSNVFNYYSLFGIFIIFFGRLYDIAVKLKKEQDLTI